MIQIPNQQNSTNLQMKLNSSPTMLTAEETQSPIDVQMEDLNHKITQKPQTSTSLLCKRSHRLMCAAQNIKKSAVCHINNNTKKASVQSPKTAGVKKYKPRDPRLRARNVLALKTIDDDCQFSNDSMSNISPGLRSQRSKKSRRGLCSAS